ncbi:MAG TPA: hypothetical protein V6C97_07720 [Oculatellaceae cyanobacterium]
MLSGRIAFMEPKLSQTHAATLVNDADPFPGSRVQRLLRMIDALNEEVEKSFDVIDDEALQAVSTRLGRVQEALHNERELRQRISRATTEKLGQNQQLPNRVKLNVHGRMFVTSLSALTSIKGTFFDSMFGGACRPLLLCS